MCLTKDSQISKANQKSKLLLVWIAYFGFTAFSFLLTAFYSFLSVSRYPLFVVTFLAPCACSLIL
jgi:hypothetical protein